MEIDFPLMRRYAAAMANGMTFESAKAAGMVQDANDEALWIEVRGNLRDYLTDEIDQEIVDAVYDMSVVDDILNRTVNKGKSFGGNRSAAGAYAASMRWKGKQQNAAPASDNPAAIPGADQIRNLKVNYNEQAGRRIIDSRGKFVTFEEDHVKVLKLQQDFNDEAKPVVEKLAKTHPKEAAIVNTSVKALSSGLTKTAAEMGDSRQTATNPPFSGVDRAIVRIGNLRGSQTLNIPEVKDALDKLETIFRKTRTAFIEFPKER